MNHIPGDLYDLVNRSVAVSEHAWNMSILSEDLIFERFSAEQREFIISASIACGNSQAEAILENFPAAKADEIAGSLGKPAKVVDFKYNPRLKLLYMGQYQKEGIFISKDAVSNVEELIQRHALTELLGEFDVKNVIIAHELFHYFEETNPNLGVDKIKVRIKIWNLFYQNVNPAVACEIAASTFSQKVTSIHFNPRILEVIHMFGIRPEVSASIVRKAEQYSREAG